MTHSSKNTLPSIFGPASRISFGLVLITFSIVLLAGLFGLMPNESSIRLENRKLLSESFAIQFSALAAEKDIKSIRKVLSAIVKRDDELLSAGFRDPTGTLIFKIGNHDKHWGSYQNHQSTTSHVLVPIFQKNIPLGNIELRFKPLPFETVKGYFSSSLYRFLFFLLIVGFLGFLFFMLRTLKQLDPSSVIPERVSAAFDTLAEGVLILDEKENIVMANTAFAENLGRTSVSLIGIKASSLNWQHTNGVSEEGLPYPWTLVQESKETNVGETLLLETPYKKIRTLVVNCAPIIDSKGRKRGVIATFDDQTEYQEQNQKLQELNIELERTNKQLHYLATRDSLTGCLNRRAFNDLFKKAFDQAKQNNYELTCLMVDIDHFKLVNDNYGHATGDEVIKLIAKVLSEMTREQDIVGRYGGEEFCVVLPGLSTERAVEIAEKIRLQLIIESKQTFEYGPHITGSLGVANIKDNAKDPDELNNQADKALYVAKETGRNKVVVWKADLEENSAESELGKLIIESTHPGESKTNNEQKGYAAKNPLDEKIRQLENLAAMFSEKSTKSQ